MKFVYILTLFIQKIKWIFRQNDEKKQKLKND